MGNLLQEEESDAHLHDQEQEEEGGEGLIQIYGVILVERRVIFPGTVLKFGDKGEETEVEIAEGEEQGLVPEVGQGQEEADPGQEEGIGQVPGLGAAEETGTERENPGQGHQNVIKGKSPPPNLHEEVEIAQMIETTRRVLTRRALQEQTRRKFWMRSGPRSPALGPGVPQGQRGQHVLEAGVPL